MSDAYERNVLIVGASGIVGRAAFEHFANAPGWKAFGASRRAPDLRVGTHIPLDLLNAEACRRTLSELPAITHVVYAALQEKPGLIEGWFDPEQMETNRQMLENLLSGVETGGQLTHVSLLQGTKAYGAHVGRMRVPGREREARLLLLLRAKVELVAVLLGRRGRRGRRRGLLLGLAPGRLGLLLVLGARERQVSAKRRRRQRCAGTARAPSSSG